MTSCRFVLPLAFGLPLALLLAGCSGGSASGTGNNPPPSPTITSVSVSCTPSSVQTGQTSQCSAMVSGTGNYNSGVTWSVSPSSVGSVSITGAFTPTISGTATITATSSQDSSKSDSSAVKAAPTLLSVQPNTVVVGATVSISAVGVDPQNLHNNVVSFTQTGRVFTAFPTAAAPQGVNTKLTVPLPSGMSPVSTSASFAVPTTVSLETNGVVAQGTMAIQVQPPAHALGASPDSAALSSSVPVSFGAVFTAFSSASIISTDDPGLTVTNVSVVSPTLITARVNVGARTVVGNHALTIGSGGLPIAFNFTVAAVAARAPEVTSLSSIQLPPAGPLTISGTGFLSSSSPPQAIIQYTYGGVIADVLETPISDSQLSTNIPLLINPNTGSPFTGSVSVQVVVNGTSSNSVPLSLLALPANAGAIGATTQAYLSNILQQISAMPTQLTPTLPGGQASFSNFLSASIQQLQQLQSQVSIAAAGGAVTAPDGSIITQSTIDIIDRLLQTSGTPSFSQLPPSALVSSQHGDLPHLRPLNQTPDNGTVNLSEAALVGAASLCMEGDVAHDMSDVLTKETLGVCVASVAGWTAPVTVPVCGFLKLFAPAQLGIEIGRAVCDVAPVNLGVITANPSTPKTTVNGPSVTEAPTGIFKSSGGVTGQVAETVTDVVLGKLELKNKLFEYILGNKVAASEVNDAIQGAFANLVGNVIDTSVPNVNYFTTNPIPLTRVSLEPPNSGFSFSGLTMTPGSNAGTVSLWFDTSAFRSLDPSGNVTNVSSVVASNQMIATIKATVAISPSQASVTSGATVQFRAIVLGVGSSLAGVSWGVDGITGGSATVGVISSSGLYTAPSLSGTHTITATSTFDASTGSATITVAASTNNPVPAITQLSPSSLTVGATPQPLTISGTGFLVASTVTLSGISHTANFVSPTQLSILLSVTDLATAGSFPVVVINPAPGGGSTNATFTVTALGVSVIPSSATVPLGAVQTFAATVSGGGGVTWSVEEGASGGKITSTGIYTAPSTTGTFHVVATSSANSAQSATATVKVIAATAYSILYSFPYAFESASLIQGADGSFYGTNEMIAYKIDSSGNFTQLATLSSSPDAPISPLIQASDGDFYGTLSIIGNNTTGEVFKMDAVGNVTVLHSFMSPGFASTDGAWPWAGLIQGRDGDFYGTTYAGGNTACVTNGYGVPAYGPFDYNLPSDSVGTGCGAVFRIDSSGTETVLHAFSGASDGSYPQAPLIQGTDGNFYGTTSAGGTDGYGTVFEIDPAGNFTLLHSFSLTDGDSPVAAVVQGTDGYLYGTATSMGGGEVFKIDTSGNNFTILHSFSGPDGYFPVASLIQGSDGSFYGTTWAGGDLTCGSWYYNVGSNYPYTRSGGCGTVFKMDSGGNVTVLHTFEEPQTGDGNDPYAGLLLGKDGYLYGTTFYGGTSITFGTIFRLSVP